MPLVLDVEPEGAWFEFQTELDSITYGFTWRWNDRLGSWFLDLADGDGNLIAAGIKVVVDVDLIAPFRGDARCPAGVLVAFDTSGQHLDPALDDLGSRVVIGYMLASDFGL